LFLVVIQQRCLRTHSWWYIWTLVRSRLASHQKHENPPSISLFLVPHTVRKVVLDTKFDIFFIFEKQPFPISACSKSGNSVIAHPCDRDSDNDKEDSRDICVIREAIDRNLLSSGIPQPEETCNLGWLLSKISVVKMLAGLPEQSLYSVPIVTQEHGCELNGTTGPHLQFWDPTGHFLSFPPFFFLSPFKYDHPSGRLLAGTVKTTGGTSWWIRWNFC